MCVCVFVCVCVCVNYLYINYEQASRDGVDSSCQTVTQKSQCRKSFLFLELVPKKEDIKRVRQKGNANRVKG